MHYSLHARLLCAALSITACLGALVPAAARAVDSGDAFAIHKGDRVVFYGDSITDQRMYTILAEEYIVTRFPNLDATFIHSGWGGDRVTGGGGGPIDLRLNRDVDAYHPTVVTIMLAMNDGNYKAYDPTTFQTYADGYKHLADKLEKDNPGVRLTFIQPSPYDDVTRPGNFEGGYNAVLVRYGQYLKELSGPEHATVADLNTPVVAMLQKADATNHDTAAKILPDRVHPGWGGHLLMAEGLLRAWHAPSVVSTVTIDAKSGKTTAENARVEKVSLTGSGGTISWAETENALPFPIQPPDAKNADSFNLALQSSDFVDALDREMLTATNLPAASYSLRIDDQEVGKFTREQLAGGINLATLPTPMLNQAQTVATLTHLHSDLHNQRWRNFEVPQAKDKAMTRALPKILAGFDAAEAEVVGEQRAAAKPVRHQYLLAPSAG